MLTTHRRHEYPEMLYSQVVLLTGMALGMWALQTMNAFYAQINAVSRPALKWWALLPPTYNFTLFKDNGLNAAQVIGGGLPAQALPDWGGAFQGFTGFDSLDNVRTS